MATDSHLSQIATMWTVLRLANGGEGAEGGRVGMAQQQLFERYTPAIYRYLVASVRDHEAAADLYQEFALRFLRGDFRRATPERGRFRDFLKTALYHLIVDHHRRRQRSPAPLEPGAQDPPVADASLVESDRSFLENWRTELLMRTWQALEAFEKTAGQHLFTVLRYRTDHPDERSPQMAERLSPLLGRPVSADWVRKRLFLAREKFADLLLDEVAGYLGSNAVVDLTEELLDLGLSDYCRSALEKRGISM